jgi:hypothetical protein
MTKSLAPIGSSETYQSCVTRLRSDYSARLKRAQAISAIGFSSSQWPTPRSSENENRTTQNAPSHGKTHGKILAGEACNVSTSMNWTTPSVCDGQRGGSITEAMSGTSLTQQVNTIWATPSVADTTGGRMARSGDRSSEMLLKGPAASLSDQWMTPRVSETDQYQYDRGNKERPVLTLQGQSQAMPTLASSLPDHPISTVGEESSKIRRTLNPLFVEWLMGWPPGWTSLALTPPASNDCACSATALSAWKQRMRSALSSLGSPPPAPPVQYTLFG